MLGYYNKYYYIYGKLYFVKKRPRHIKLQKEELIRVNCEKSIELANENGFKYNDFDESNHRLSFYDANKSYRLDETLLTNI